MTAVYCICKYPRNILPYHIKDIRDSGKMVEASSIHSADCVASSRLIKHSAVKKKQTEREVRNNCKT